MEARKEVTAKSAIEAYSEANEKIRYQMQIDELRKMYAEEKCRNDAHNEIAKVYLAYIAILLDKLGATKEDAAVVITDIEIKHKMEHYETRCVEPEKGVWKLYAVKKD